MRFHKPKLLRLIRGVHMLVQRHMDSISRKIIAKLTIYSLVMGFYSTMSLLGAVRILLRERLP